MPRLDFIEGIGPANQQKLKKAGVRSTDSLLKKGATSKGRKELEAKSGIGGKQLLEWVNHADLFRIKGVGSEYADLLEEAGVDTVVELAQRLPENLHKAMLDVNKKKKLVRRLPTVKTLKGWIAQAKKLPRLIQY